MHNRPTAKTKLRPNFGTKRYLFDPLGLNLVLRSRGVIILTDPLGLGYSDYGVDPRHE
jgi:hypothetical protein